MNFIIYNCRICSILTPQLILCVLKNFHYNLSFPVVTNDHNVNSYVYVIQMRKRPDRDYTDVQVITMSLNGPCSLSILSFSRNEYCRWDLTILCCFLFPSIRFIEASWSIFDVWSNTHYRSASLSALKTCNTMNWPGGAAILLHHSPTLCTLGLGFPF